MPPTRAASIVRQAKQRLKVGTRARAAMRAFRGAPVTPVVAVTTPTRGEADPDVVLLSSTPLFDVEWYAATAGCAADRDTAVTHYLLTGHGRGLSPHPLFDPAFYVSRLPEEDRACIPFVHYLSRAGDADACPGPLFDAGAYAADNPDAQRHPGGLLGHYVEVGAVAGARPNSWFVPQTSSGAANLTEWARARRAEWAARNDDVPRLAWKAPGRLDGSGPHVQAVAGTVRDLPSSYDAPWVSVIVNAGADPAVLAEAVGCVRGQTLTEWELIVVHGDQQKDISTVVAEEENRVRVVAQAGPNLATAFNVGLGVARGTYVAWMSGGDLWEPGYLERAVAALRGEPAGAAQSVVRVLTRPKATPDLEAAGSRPKTRTRFAAQPATPARLAAGLRVDLSALVVARELASGVGGFDETLPAAAVHDFVLKVARHTHFAFVPVVGVTRDDERRTRDAITPDPLDRSRVVHTDVATWADVVLNRHTVPWTSIAADPSVDVSVVIPTHQDWAMTAQAVRRVADAAAGSALSVQTVVWDNGCGPEASVVLDSLPLQFPSVEVAHSPVNHGFALGNNRALEHVRGRVVVFLNNDTEVASDWLEPLVTALEDPEILGAQSLMFYPNGTIQSAGVAFPSCGGIPHPLLRGFPAEDAAGMESATINAPTAAALAMRLSDVVALRGFDPLFRNGMEDVDLGLRARQLRPGRFTVRPDSRVTHRESKSPGRFAHSTLDRALLLDRWDGRMPRDDVALWREAGFDVVGYGSAATASRKRPPDADRRLEVPTPVLVRRCETVQEGLPPLRWAIKNPSPNTAAAARWGDTHFAGHLARALRRLGQSVVVDIRPAFHRRTGYLDDVVLVIRGLARYRPAYGQVNILWLISHPELVSRAEAESYDRVFAASATWAERMSRQWGFRIDPLLQATDPEFFHPDRARPDTGHPVLFVGNSRHLLRPIVGDAVEQQLPLSVYGSHWDQLIPSKLIVAGSIPNEQVGAAYRAAGVVLNDHWEDMRTEGFISNRLFDAAASGARVVTDDVAGLGTLFGRSVQVARDAEDLGRLATAPDLDAIFGDDAERRGVAAMVHAEHNFDVRARQLLDAALELRSSSRPAPESVEHAHLTEPGS